MADMKAGRFKGKAIPQSIQYGEAGESKTLQIAVDLTIPELERTCTTFLYFSQAAAPYSFERLRALGWKGDDIRNLAGIDANEVDVEVRNESYQGKTQWRVEILTGPGRVTLSNTLDKEAFAARLKAVMGNTAPTGGAGVVPAGGSADAPPF